MKTLTFLFALTLSLSSLAGIDTVKNVLDLREIEVLDADLDAKGFTLTTVTDLYAVSGVRPRCICESFELSFTKYVSGGNKTEKYSVSTSGFGRNLKVKINKTK